MNGTSAWKRVGLPVSGVLVASIIAVGVGVACSKSPSGPVVYGGDAGTPPYGPACSTDAGSVPASDCDPWQQEICGGDWEKCLASGKTVMSCDKNSACLAMADNTKKSTYDFRIRKLTIVAPAVLAEQSGGSPGFVATGVLDPGVQLNGFCGDPKGTLGGAFNWLARFDPVANTVVTGGAPPTADPFDAGYCFANFNASGVAIGPVTYKVTTTATAGGGTSFSADPTQDAVVNHKLYVPIFNNGKTDPADLILLPLSHPVFQDVRISADHNCIGAVNTDAVKGDCSLDTQCSEWHTAGAIAGYITLKDANTVIIPLVNNESLCAILMTKSSCTPDGGDVVIDKSPGGVHGDYCAATGVAGPDGCEDSVWLSAVFAASAATINNSGTDPLCTGTGPLPTDGGATDAAATDSGATDSGSASDAGVPPADAASNG